jgi:hypothetical protein
MLMQEVQLCLHYQDTVWKECCICRAPRTVLCLDHQPVEECQELRNESKHLHSVERAAHGAYIVS